jgi:hypothetical protein
MKYIARSHNGSRLNCDIRKGRVKLCLFVNIARSSNGRTPPSGGGYLGSSPGLAAIKKKPYKIRVFIAARSEVSAYLMPWTRNAFPCECIHEWKSCTEAVSFEKCTHGPGLAARFL